MKSSVAFSTPCPFFPSFLILTPHVDINYAAILQSRDGTKEQAGMGITLNTKCQDLGACL